MTAEGCALVTGAGRGIGAATAVALADAGWPVAVNYRSDPEGAGGVVAAIGRAGGRGLAVEADVSDTGQVAKMFECAEAELGPVMVLVNNAGVRADGLAPQLDARAWDSVIETNLSAAFHTTRRALGPMLRARFGRIVNVASIVGLRANAGQANYAASKAGLVGLTKTVAVEVARRGITVNAVAPGLVETRLTEGILKPGASTAARLGYASQGLADAIPARRAGRPEEVAACVRFLVSDEAAYVTGSVLTVDGGLSA